MALPVVLLLAKYRTVPDLLAAGTSTIRGVAAVGAGFFVSVVLLRAPGGGACGGGAAPRSSLRAARTTSSSSCLMTFCSTLVLAIQKQSLPAHGPDPLLLCGHRRPSLLISRPRAWPRYAAAMSAVSPFGVRWSGWTPWSIKRRDDFSMVFGVGVAATCLVQWKPSHYIRGAGVRAVA